MWTFLQWGECPKPDNNYSAPSCVEREREREKKKERKKRKEKKMELYP